ncbi:MAG: GTP-binding protein [Prolixibacteraceae bacterium]
MEKQNKVNIHLVGGFLGSGKTTAISTASKLIQEQGIQVGVVTNDQGKYLVDSRFISAKQIPFGQVTNGCFCCNYNQLDEQIEQLRDRQGVRLVFAESVGSCTDLIASVVKPLSIFRNGETERITLSIFTEAELLFNFLKFRRTPFSKNIAYIYSKQIEEAEILVVNKTDLLKEDVLEKLKILLTEKFPEKTVLYQNSLDRQSVSQWIELLAKPPGKMLPERKSLEIDYLIYGAGEADLAWFDQEITVTSDNSDAVQIAKQIVIQILAGTESRNWAIGHLKFILETDTESHKISFTTNVNLSDLEKLPELNSGTAKLLVNARIETGPEDLKKMVAGIVQNIRIESKATILELYTSAFKPGFPNPTHRMSNAG